MTGEYLGEFPVEVDTSDRQKMALIFFETHTKNITMVGDRH